MKNLNVCPENDEFRSSKFPGFDITDEIPNQNQMTSYNNEFYNTIKEYKIIDIPVPQKDKLLYRFEANPNAGVTSTTFQIQETLEDIKNASQIIYNEITILKEEIKILREKIEVCDNEFITETQPKISNIRRTVQNFLINQKTENFKLIKDIAVLEKEKVDLQSKIFDAVSKCHRLECFVGTKPQIYNLQQDMEITSKFNID